MKKLLGFLLLVSFCAQAQNKFLLAQWRPEGIKHNGATVTDWVSTNGLSIKPVVAPAYIQAAVNGKAAIYGDGHAWMRRPGFIQPSRWTLYMVMKIDAQQNERQNIGILDNHNGISINYDNERLSAQFVTGEYTVSPEKDKWIIFTVTQNAYALTISTNAGKAKSYPNLAFDLGQNDFSLFASIGGAHPFKGSIAFLSIYLGQLSTGENNAIMKNLGKEFGLPVSPSALSTIPEKKFDPILQNKDATGSIAEGSNVLTLDGAHGYKAGDDVIVKTGGETGPSFIRMGKSVPAVGVGGVWPLKEINSLSETVAAGIFVRLKSNGRVYQMLTDGLKPMDYRGYHYQWSNPFSLVAKVISVSGNKLTLDQVAKATSVKTKVYYDNTPYMNDMVKKHMDFKRTAKGGRYAFSGGIYTERRRGQTFDFNGATLFSPDGCASFSFTLNGYDNEVYNVTLIGNNRFTGYAFPKNSYAESGSLGNPFPGFPTLVFEGHNSTAKNIHVIDGFYSLRSRGRNNLFQHCSVEMTNGENGYVFWAIQQEGTGEGSVFDDISFKSPTIVHALECFDASHVVMKNIHLTNGIAALNSTHDCIYKDITFDFTAHSKPDSTNSSYWQWFNNGYPCIDKNSRINASNSKGDTLLNMRFNFLGFIDGISQTMTGIQCSGGTNHVSIIGGGYKAPTRPKGTYSVSRGIQMEASYALIDGFTMDAPSGDGEIAKDNNFSIEVKYGEGLGSEVRNTVCKYLVLGSPYVKSTNNRYQKILLVDH